MTKKHKDEDDKPQTVMGTGTQDEGKVVEDVSPVGVDTVVEGDTRTENTVMGKGEDHK